MVFLTEDSNAEFWLRFFLHPLCRTLKLWDIKTRECLHTLEGHRDAVLAATVRSLNSVALRSDELVTSYSGFGMSVIKRTTTN